jgi:hypothetical protein
MWNGDEAATLVILDADFISLELPPLFQGHHSIFAYLACDVSCPHPVNGSVFFSAFALPPAAPTQSSASSTQPTLFSDARARRILNEEERHVPCSAADVLPFLSPYMSTVNKNDTSSLNNNDTAGGGGSGTRYSHMLPVRGRHGKEEMEELEQGKYKVLSKFASRGRVLKVVDAVASLHIQLRQAVEQRPHDPNAWAALARLLMSLGRIANAAHLYRVALRVYAVPLSI